MKIQNMETQSSTIKYTVEAIQEALLKPFMASKIEWLLTVTGSLFVWLVGLESIPLIQSLLIMIVLDFIFAIMRDYKKGKTIKAGLIGKTPAKIVTYIGLMVVAKKIGEIFHVEGLTTVVAVFYIAVEAKSILSSVDCMEIPIPQSLKSLIKDKIDKESDLEDKQIK